MDDVFDDAFAQYQKDGLYSQGRVPLAPRDLTPQHLQDALGSQYELDDARVFGSPSHFMPGTFLLHLSSRKEGEAAVLGCFRGPQSAANAMLPPAPHASWSQLSQAHSLVGPKLLGELCGEGGVGHLRLYEHPDNNRWFPLAKSLDSGAEDPSTVLRAVAALHAAHWNASNKPDIAHLQPTEEGRRLQCQSFLAGISDVLEDESLEQFVSEELVGLATSLKAYFEPLCMFGLLSPDPCTLCHNHLIPTTLHANPADPSKVLALEWEHCRVGSPGFDVATVICLSVDADIRRLREEDLLKTYLHELESHGVRRDEFTLEDLYSHYRLGVLLLIPKMVQLYALANDSAMSDPEAAKAQLGVWLQRLSEVVQDLEMEPDESGFASQSLTKLLEALVRELVDIFDPSAPSLSPTDLADEDWSDITGIQLSYMSPERETIFVQTALGVATLKCPAHPVEELFAASLATAMGIHHPYTHVLTRSSEAHKTLLRQLDAIRAKTISPVAVTRLERFLHNRPFVVMQEYVLGGPSRSLMFIGLKGRALLCPMDLEEEGNDNEFDQVDEFGMLRLEEFGEIAAFNVFLNSADSFPIGRAPSKLATGNPKNVLFNISKSAAVNEYTIILDHAANPVDPAGDVEGYERHRKQTARLLLGALDGPKEWAVLLNFLLDYTGTILHRNTMALCALQRGFVRGVSSIAQLTAADITNMWTHILGLFEDPKPQTMPGALSYLLETHKLFRKVAAHPTAKALLATPDTRSQLLSRLAAQGEGEGEGGEGGEGGEDEQRQPREQEGVSLGDVREMGVGGGQSDKPVARVSVNRDLVGGKNATTPRQLRRTTTGSNLDGEGDGLGLFAPPAARVTSPWEGIPPRAMVVVTHGTELFKYGGINKHPRHFVVNEQGTALLWYKQAPAKKSVGGFFATRLERSQSSQTIGGERGALDFKDVKTIRRSAGRVGTLLSLEWEGVAAHMRRYLFVKFPPSEPNTEVWIQTLSQLVGHATGRRGHDIVQQISHEMHSRLK